MPTTSPHSRTIVCPSSRRVTSPYSKTCFAGSRIQRSALQAAGYTCSPWRIQVRDHGFDRVLFLCRRREGFCYSLHYIGADYDTELKSTAAIDKEKTYMLRDGNIITAALSVSVLLIYCSSRTVPTYGGCTLHLASFVFLVVTLQRTCCLLTDCTFSLPPLRGRLLVRSKGKRATSSQITAEFKIGCGMFRQGALADEAVSLSALNASVTRKYCPGQILMVKRPAASSTLLSRRSVTLTSAGTCTLMSCRQAAFMSKETVSA